MEEIIEGTVVLENPEENVQTPEETPQLEYAIVFGKDLVDNYNKVVAFLLQLGEIISRVEGEQTKFTYDDKFLEMFGQAHGFIMNLHAGLQEGVKAAKEQIETEIETEENPV